MKKLLLPLLVVVLAVSGYGIIRYQKTRQALQPSEANVSDILPSESSLYVDQPATQETSAPKAAEITLTVTSPADRATVTSASLTVKGKTSPGAEVFANDAATVADVNGNFSARLTLDEGENSIVIFANDADGRVVEKELTVTYDSGQ